MEITRKTTYKYLKKIIKNNINTPSKLREYKNKFGRKIIRVCKKINII
jgi:hypothetical protein